MMRIGMLGHGFVEWMGGVDFLRMIIDSLLAADPTLELHLLVPNSGPLYQARSWLRRIKRLGLESMGRPVGKHQPPGQQIINELMFEFGGRLRLHQIDIGERAIRRASVRLQLDVLLPSIVPLKNQSLPWIGYLPDFQHAYYPEFFSEREIIRRNIVFRRMLESASHLIVNAHAVANDIDRFYPMHRARIIVLPFSASPNPRWLELGPPDLNSYGINGPYFIISNQFWQHKDHKTAWYALALLMRQRPEVKLVCTGSTQDYRNPRYFEALVRLSSELGIDGHVVILGVVPKDEQIKLIRGSVALVQPTLFEGGPGGGAVFDAVSVGVPCIVSDVPINRELDHPGVSFFKAGDPVSLCEAMNMALDRYPFQKRPAPHELMAGGRERRRRCGRVLIDLVRSMV